MSDKPYATAEDLEGMPHVVTIDLGEGGPVADFDRVMREASEAVQAHVSTSGIEYTGLDSFMLWRGRR